YPRIKPMTEAIIIVQVEALNTSPSSGKRSPKNVDNAETKCPIPKRYIICLNCGPSLSSLVAAFSSKLLCIKLVSVFVQRLNAPANGTSQNMNITQSA